MIKSITYDEAEEAVKTCDWAFAAHQPPENPINWADAASFYMEGYNDAVDKMKEERG